MRFITELCAWRKWEAGYPYEQFESKNTTCFNRWLGKGSNHLLYQNQAADRRGLIGRYCRGLRRYSSPIYLTATVTRGNRQKVIGRALSRAKDHIRITLGRVRCTTRVKLVPLAPDTPFPTSSPPSPPPSRNKHYHDVDHAPSFLVPGPRRSS